MHNMIRTLILSLTAATLTGCPEKEFDTSADPDLIQININPVDASNGAFLRSTFTAYSNGQSSEDQSTFTEGATPSADDLKLFVEPGDDVYVQVVVVLEFGEGDENSSNEGLIELVNECAIPEAGMVETVNATLTCPEGASDDDDCDLDVNWEFGGDAGCRPLEDNTGLTGGRFGGIIGGL
jgi:hypothetical protein